jgi:hypothetical protein
MIAGRSIFLGTLLATGLTVSTADAVVYSVNNFERYSLAAFKHVKIGKGKAKVVNSPRKGNFAARLETAPGNRARSELVIDSPKELANGQNYSFRFANRVDPSWADSKRGSIVFNVHKRREAGDAHGKQPVSLYVRNGRWVFSVRGDSNKNSTLKSLRAKHFDLGPVQKGAWNDWQVDYKPSFNNDGAVRVVHNGREVVNFRGATAFNDSRGGFAKFGIYTPAGKGKVGRRAIDFDQVSATGGSAQDAKAKKPRRAWKKRRK